MKRTTLISLTAAVIILGTSILYAQAERTASGTAGSFQLFSGHYTITGDKVSVDDFGVFRIDTRTGKTWQYTNSVKPGKEFSGWMEIGEYTVQTK
jgi:hypothetical protein